MDVDPSGGCFWLAFRPLALHDTDTTDHDLAAAECYKPPLLDNQFKSMFFCGCRTDQDAFTQHNLKRTNNIASGAGSAEKRHRTTRIQTKLWCGFGGCAVSVEKL